VTTEEHIQKFNDPEGTNYRERNKQTHHHKHRLGCKMKYVKLKRQVYTTPKISQIFAMREQRKMFKSKENLILNFKPDINHKVLVAEKQ
jgi:hypothetical protein